MRKCSVLKRKNISKSILVKINGENYGLHTFPFRYLLTLININSFSKLDYKRKY